MYEQLHDFDKHMRDKPPLLIIQRKQDIWFNPNLTLQIVCNWINRSQFPKVISERAWYLTRVSSVILALDFNKVSYARLLAARVLPYPWDRLSLRLDSLLSEISYPSKWSCHQLLFYLRQKYKYKWSEHNFTIYTLFVVESRGFVRNSFLKFKLLLLNF